MKHSKKQVALKYVDNLSQARRERWGVELIGDPHDEVIRLAVNRPEGLVSIWGYLKHQAAAHNPNSMILLRGESGEHTTIAPSLFRTAAATPVRKVLAAQRALENEVQLRFKKMRRFRTSDIAALLQHYGFNTSWVDVVDNLFVASWFAFHRRSPKAVNGTPRYARSSRKFGWIRFMDTAPSGLKPLHVKDLRRQHLSINLRPHVQHGMSVTRVSLPEWDRGGTDLNEYVPTIVRIPNEKQFWGMSGHMLSADFLFPSKDDDDTLYKLSFIRMAEAVREVEERSGLLSGTFGKVDEA